jgi:hypothetical protein
MPKLNEAWKIHPQELVVTLRNHSDAPALVTDETKFTPIDGGVYFIPWIHPTGWLIDGAFI